MDLAHKYIKLEINLHSVTVISRLDNKSVAKSVSRQVRLQGRSHTVRGALNCRIRWRFTSLFLEDKAFRPLSSFSLSPLLLISAIPLSICEPSFSPSLSLSRSFIFFLYHSSFRVYQKRGSTQRILLPGRPPTCLSRPHLFSFSFYSSRHFFPAGCKGQSANMEIGDCIQERMRSFSLLALPSLERQSIWGKNGQNNSKNLWKQLLRAKFRFPVPQPSAFCATLTFYEYCIVK